ncbi:MAG TPA: ABC transporter ATP-binding protein [Chloroflexota bacterium]|nr:ABC transporter ATP-binding protein [Chloroflexota bacterium]
MTPLASSPSVPLVQTVGLTKTYGHGEAAVTALDHVAVSIAHGEFVAVMGPSGCGKSTLLHLIGGLDRPTSGSVMLDGTDTSTLDDTRLTELRRRKLGFVFQFFNLLPVLSAVDNAALPLILDGHPPDRARAAAGDWLRRLGMGERLTHRPSQLSGGQQQRVALARALCAEPRLILADEPTGNLDTRAADEIAGLLRDVAGPSGRAVLMVTHDPRLAAYADRIVFLKDGKVVDETRLGGDHETQIRETREKVAAL